ncbi:Alpha-glucosidase 2 [Claviceps africana]|uniref:Alpha-galactosidase n=1 Tax=Claviceps africana TaxID=83212 RepID=A0A8K0J9U5_9HYPO|nr:Alpha-glucosidase 2 [Claviceps africana]
MSPAPIRIAAGSDYRNSLHVKTYLVHTTTQIDIPPFYASAAYDVAGSDAQTDVSAQARSIAAGSRIGTQRAIEVDGTTFALHGDGVSYRFRVDGATGDVLGDHFDGPVRGDTVEARVGPVQGWVGMTGRVRRELLDLGRGDFRTPAVRIRQSQGHTVSRFRYRSREVMEGKTDLPGLPSTFGDRDDVSILVVRLYDEYSSVAAALRYSIFPKYDAVVRSVNITNMGEGNMTLEKVASFSVDLSLDDWDMLQLGGDWAREGRRVRREVGLGTQEFESTTGYSSHLHNPFLALAARTTTESHGEAYGFSLVYPGSFAAEVERGSQGLTWAMLGLNPLQFSWPLRPGESFVSPECVAVFSSTGIGGMSRKLHGLYRRHLMRSKFATRTRPVLLNSWEGLGFEYDASAIYTLAEQSAALGVRLFVLDDGWFGNKYPRVSDDAGLGDWHANGERFPDGLAKLVDDITRLPVAHATGRDRLVFGIWVESEMVNPHSSLYQEHPGWALHAADYHRTLARNQLLLKLALPQVQEFVVASVSGILDGCKASYVKWDNNRGIHETPAPYTGRQYMLGLYKVYRTLVDKYPTERVYIQFGTSLAYPSSAMGAHVSAASIEFRAHVAMMGGSFGLELNKAHLPQQDKAKMPALIELAERVNPLIIQGDMWRLRLPEDSNYPAALFISQVQKQAVLFCFKLYGAHVNDAWPSLRLEGLDASARYRFDGNQTVSGATLMSKGISYQLTGEFDSRVAFLEKV